jgi:transcriptional regulator with XRE-family HTH domain
MTGFGTRLAEERKRLGYRQGAFAALVGTDVPKQSLYENGHRELRAPYLSRIAAAGVDVTYVITGRRSEGFSFGDDADALLAAYLSLPPDLQQTLIRLLGDLGEHSGRSPGRTP